MRSFCSLREVIVESDTKPVGEKHVDTPKKPGDTQPLNKERIDTSGKAEKSMKIRHGTQFKGAGIAEAKS